MTDMENLWANDYPALSVRERRKTVRQTVKPNGLTAKDCLIWVDGGTLYVNGAATGLVLSDSAKQLISMGAYLVIWPDKKYINTADLTDFGSLENRVETTGTVSFCLCNAEGEEWSDYVCSDNAPEDPTGGALWLDTSGGCDILRRYGESGWSGVDNACVRISAAGIHIGFQAGDGVTIAGAEETQLNGGAVIQAVGTGYIVVPGVLRAASTQTTAMTVSRSVPAMDYVTQCGNRLWGCKYGMVNGTAVNEIYGCKLGDFKNWNCFQGLSTDSYAASRGSDGVFTAAAAYLGEVLFFKENCMERLCISSSGAHQIITTQCPGVKRGCNKSVVEVDGTLYYLAIGGVYAYQGSLPVPVSQCWGEMRGTGAVGGALEGQYYLSFTDLKQKKHLMVYDTVHGLWHRQDAVEIRDFAGCDGELFAMTADGKLLQMRGGDSESISWMAQSNDLGQDNPSSRYLERLILHLELEDEGQAEALVSYDGGTNWEKQGKVNGQSGGLRRATLYLRPRRCQHLRLQLRGKGRCKVYSISAVYEKGSDGP